MSILTRLLLALFLVSSACRAEDVAVPKAPAAAAPLRKAREMLRLAEETRGRIQRELDALHASGKSEPTVETDYQTYLDRVSKMAEAYAQIVREMEALAGSSALEEPIAPDPGAGLDAGSAPAVAIPDSDALDPIRALDRELNAALSEFDKILLKEHAEIGAKMEEVAQSNNEKLQELAQQAAEAAAKIKGKQNGSSGGKTGAEGAGAEAVTAETTASNTGGEKGEETAGAKPGTPEDGGLKPGESSGVPGETGGGQTAGTPNGGSTGTGQGGASTAAGKPGPENGKGGRKVIRPGAEDDDIVARQLREAAEAETDPSLKEKLWKEYDEYKKSSRR